MRLKEEYQSYIDDLVEKKALYIHRRNHILDVFKERLAVYDSRSSLLTAADILEKRISKSTLVSPDGNVILNHPRLDGPRKAVKITPLADGAGFKLSFAGNKADANNVISHLSGRADGISVVHDSNTVTITLSGEEQLSQFEAAYTEEELKTELESQIPARRH